MWLFGRGVKDVATPVRSSRDHTIRPECFVYDVPPSPWSIVEAISRTLKPRTHVRWQAGLRWKLGNDVAEVIVCLTLKKGGLKVDVIQVKHIVGGVLTSKAKAWT